VFGRGADFGSSFANVEMFLTMSYQCSVGSVRGQQTLQIKQFLVWLSGWCVGGRRGRPNYLQNNNQPLPDMDYINTLGAVSDTVTTMDL